MKVFNWSVESKNNLFQLNICCIFTDISWSTAARPNANLRSPRMIRLQKSQSKVNWNIIHFLKEISIVCIFLYLHQSFLQSCWHFFKHKSKLFLQCDNFFKHLLSDRAFSWLKCDTIIFHLFWFLVHLHFFKYWYQIFFLCRSLSSLDFSSNKIWLS